MEEHLNNIINYLLSKNTFVQIDIIAYIVAKDKDLAPVFEELERLKIVNIKTGENGKKWYMIKKPVRDEIITLSDEYQKDIYKYLIEKERAEIEQTRLHKWYESENARQQYEDYPRVRREARIALICAIASAIITLIALLK